MCAWIYVSYVNVNVCSVHHMRWPVCRPSPASTDPKLSRQTIVMHRPHPKQRLPPLRHNTNSNPTHSHAGGLISRAQNIHVATNSPTNATRSCQPPRTHSTRIALGTGVRGCGGSCEWRQTTEMTSIPTSHLTTRCTT